jgi:hypothetical protein
VGPHETQPPISRTFVVVTFAASIAIGAIIIYLGVNGMIGAGFP